MAVYARIRIPRNLLTTDNRPITLHLMFREIFIMKLFEDGRGPLVFVIGMFTVVLSITIHELAHGWAAIRKGDHTPIHTGHMTINPLVHMGPFSIMALMIVGIAWGQMPIDPTRMRGRYAEAIVAAAGPASNVILALVALTVYGIWIIVGIPDTDVSVNVEIFLRTFGFLNLFLCGFNLLPVPPLDGSHILANFSRGYGNWVGDPNNGGTLMLAFMFAFMFAGIVVGPVASVATDLYLSIFNSIAAG